MQNLSMKYKNIIIFATLIQPNLTSVDAQLDIDNAQGSSVKKQFDEKIYKTDDLKGAINYYIKSYLETYEKEA